MKKKSQAIGILLLLISLISVSALVFLSYIGHKAYFFELKRESEYRYSFYNIKILIENYLDPDTNMTIKEMLIYRAITGNDIFESVNVTEKVKEFFDNLFDDRWAIEVQRVTTIKAWIIKAYFREMTLWNWDTSIYEDLIDEYGNYWFENIYDDSDWVYAVFPLYQGKVVEEILNINPKLCEDLSSTYPEIFMYLGSYYCRAHTVDPFRMYMNFEACTWEGDTEHPVIRITKDLPKDIEIEEFAYLFFNNPNCDSPGASKELKSKVYEKFITYNTITNIEELAKASGFSGKYFVTYTRGVFYVPEYCEEVYMEALWNELARIYVNGVFLFANCYNKNPRIPQVVLPEKFCSPQPGKGCLHGTPTWGIVRANITEYVKIGDVNLVAILFGVPHDIDNPPSCYPNIDKDFYLGINTLGGVRIFCLDKNKDIYELNYETTLPPKTIVKLGYDYDDTKDIYTEILLYYIHSNEEAESKEIIYVKIYIW